MYVLVLHVCITTGRSLEDSDRNIWEAIEGCNHALHEAGDPVPVSTSLVGQVELSPATQCPLRIGPTDQRCPGGDCSPGVRLYGGRKARFPGPIFGGEFVLLYPASVGIVMKPLIFALSVVFAFGGLSAQTPGWQPSPGHTQVPIWPGAAPDAQPAAGPENARTDTKLVAGRPWVYVDNVSRPTMTVYSPKGKDTGAAVVVFPGGGYQILAMDLEGTEVCDWLTSKGITCVLLKYRVPYSGPYWDERCRCHMSPKAPMALEDAQRTVGLVRFHAAQWHIDPHKIGVLGFSAGGHLVAAVSTHLKRRSYPAVDAADKESCRPDFAVALYPGHLWVEDEKLELNPDVPVTSQTPPTFLLQAEDDHVDNVNHSLVYYIALKNAGVPVEMHLYAQGGHAFGLRRTKLPIAGWPHLVETWLRTLGMIPE